MNKSMEGTKEYLAYCDIYANIFHLLGFKEEQRDLCDAITKQCIKDLDKYKTLDFKTILKAGI